MSGKKDKKKGGVGGKLLALIVVVGIGTGVAWYFAPGTVESGLRALRDLLGV